jgi:hypothetical protein
MLTGAPPLVLRPGFMCVSRGSEVGFGLRGDLGGLIGFGSADMGRFPLLSCFLVTAD